MGVCTCGFGETTLYGHHPRQCINTLHKHFNGIVIIIWMGFYSIQFNFDNGGNPVTDKQEKAKDRISPTIHYLLSFQSLVYSKSPGNKSNTHTLLHTHLKYIVMSAGVWDMNFGISLNVVTISTHWPQRASSQ